MTAGFWARVEALVQEGWRDLVDEGFQDRVSKLPVERDGVQVGVELTARSSAGEERSEQVMFPGPAPLAEQLGLFSTPSPSPSTALRTPLPPLPTASSPSPARPECAACGCPDSRILAVEGAGLELLTRWVCARCNTRWEVRTLRADVCPHGWVRIIPCEDCGRTWEQVEAEIAAR